MITKPEALRLADALDAEFVQGRISNSTGRESAVELRRLHEALETEQEPVAWITDGGKGELWWYQSSKFDEEGNLIGPNPDDIPLYTAPPKREWVRLTEKEIRAMAKPDHGVGIDLTGRMWVFIADLTDKLKEKNHGDQSQAEGAQ